MGLSCRPIGKFKSLTSKLDSQAEKSKKKKVKENQNVKQK